MYVRLIVGHELTVCDTRLFLGAEKPSSPHVDAMQQLGRADQVQVM